MAENNTSFAQKGEIVIVLWDEVEGSDRLAAAVEGDFGADGLGGGGGVGDGSAVEGAERADAVGELLIDGVPAKLPQRVRLAQGGLSALHVDDVRLDSVGVAVGCGLRFTGAAARGNAQSAIVRVAGGYESCGQRNHKEGSRWHGRDFEDGAPGPIHSLTPMAQTKHEIQSLLS